MFTQRAETRRSCAAFPYDPGTVVPPRSRLAVPNPTPLQFAETARLSSHPGSSRTGGQSSVSPQTRVLPAGPDGSAERPPGPVCCDASGRIYLLAADELRGLLVMYSTSGLRAPGRRVWQRSIVASDLNIQLGWSNLFLDSDQRPVVVSTNPKGGRAGVRAFRTR